MFKWRALRRASTSFEAHLSLGGKVWVLWGGRFSVLAWVNAKNWTVRFQARLPTATRTMFLEECNIGDVPLPRYDGSSGQNLVDLGYPWSWHLLKR